MLAILSTRLSAFRGSQGTVALYLFNLAYGLCLMLKFEGKS